MTIRAERLLPAKLPTVFTYSQARAGGLTDRDLRTAREDGRVAVLSRGLYERQDRPAVDSDLAQIALRAPQATLCLRSALAHHDLIDDIPKVIDVAVPRQQRRPAISAPVRWHRFDSSTFAVGRQPYELDGGLSLSIYNPARSIIDAFRLPHLEGPELAHTALKSWLRMRGSHPTELIAMTKHFPAARTAVHEALAILL